MAPKAARSIDRSGAGCFNGVDAKIRVRSSAVVLSPAVSVDAHPSSSGEDGPLHDSHPLPVQGFRGTPDEIERQWYEQVYRGRGDRMAQLTWRAVIMVQTGYIGNRLDREHG